MAEEPSTDVVPALPAATERLLPATTERLPGARKAAVLMAALGSERAANVQGAFRVPDEGKAAVAGRRLILVDDVLTSGATVDGCARALIRAGAANVDVVIFARVADPGRTSI